MRILSISAHSETCSKFSINIPTAQINVNYYYPLISSKQMYWTQKKA